MKNWYTIQNKIDGIIDISLHDEIGLWGVSARDFIAELRGYSGIKVINLSIHSPGGSVLDGLAMYNALRDHPAKVYGHVEGIAASAASFVLMAADVISMPEDAFIMIHNAWVMAMGDSDELRDVADVLDKMQGTVMDIYERRTGMDRDDLAAMMKAETWMNSADALELGFIDTITDAVKAAAKAHAFAKYFKTLPADAEPVGVEHIESVTDFEKCLRDAGLSRGLAQALTSRAKDVFLGDPGKPDDALAQVSAALDKAKIPEQISDPDAG